MQVKIPCDQTMTIYQALAPKIKELKALGLSNEEIAARLNINKKTVGKALALADLKVLGFYNAKNPCKDVTFSIFNHIDI